ncbi:hypothetical protein BDN71DRAFT_1450918 [Pleurotus eryngii]|uniref:tRNA-dihydrouridine(16/17) synthase [NAD(P)(+)] n=1 Tax=Pleurotus eryngii TaxID=5323 RepID=A0A9P6DDJ8_PLEER|nr:hypothetical protein BDN71DRAFT_1450918 [Pleurotus eryngii]
MEKKARSVSVTSTSLTARKAVLWIGRSSLNFPRQQPEALLASAKHIEKHCDAVDINLGCPQEIAKRGRYGSFLQDDWELIYSVSTLAVARVG